MNINIIHTSVPDRGTDLFEILDLPADVLVLVFSLLCGQDIARCKRVCRFFLDVIVSHLHLQYAIDLVQNGMVNGDSSILPLSERLQRLRQYSSNFSNGIFYREGSAAHPDYWRRLHQFDRTWSKDANDSSTSLYNSLSLSQEESHPLLSVFTPGSAQAGILSRRRVARVGSPADHVRPGSSSRVWAVDSVRNLLAVCEVDITAFLGGERIVIHFHALSRSKKAPTAHPGAALPSVQIWPLGGSSDLEMESTGTPKSLCLSGDHVIWQIMTIAGGTAEENYSIGICNWTTGEIVKRIDVGGRLVHVVPLNNPYLFMTMGDHKLKTFDIYSFFPSLPYPRICRLQLPNLRPGEILESCHLLVSQLPQTREGHFHPDPEHSMVSLTRDIRGPDCTYTSVLLVPCAALHAQVHAAMSAQRIRARSDSGARPPPAPVVPWREWGRRACLHLRLRVRPAWQPTPSSITMLPFGSRMPLVVSTNTSPTWASICVVDINPLAARYAKSLVRVGAMDGAPDGSQGATAIIAPEDMERVLPGVVDPKCSAIPYAIYRFELPVSPTEWPLGHSIRRAQMNMTGFTLKFNGAEFEEMEQTWAI